MNNNTLILMTATRQQLGMLLMMGPPVFMHEYGTAWDWSLGALLLSSKRTSPVFDASCHADQDLAVVDSLTYLRREVEKQNPERHFIHRVLNTSIQGALSKLEAEVRKLYHVIAMDRRPLRKRTFKDVVVDVRSQTFVLFREFYEVRMNR